VVEDRTEDAELAVRELRRAALNCETQRVDKADAFRRALGSSGRISCSPTIRCRVWRDGGARDSQGRGARHPLIIVTGSLDEETAAECIKAGAADYVLKTNLIRLGPAIAVPSPMLRARPTNRSPSRP